MRSPRADAEREHESAYWDKGKMARCGSGLNQIKGIESAVSRVEVVESPANGNCTIIGAISRVWPERDKTQGAPYLVP